MEDGWQRVRDAVSWFGVAPNPGRTAPPEHAWLLDHPDALGELKVTKNTAQWSHGPWKAHLNEEWHLKVSDRNRPGWAVYVHIHHPDAMGVLGRGVTDLDMLSWMRQVLLAARAMADRESED